MRKSGRKDDDDGDFYCRVSPNPISNYTDHIKRTMNALSQLYVQYNCIQSVWADAVDVPILLPRMCMQMACTLCMELGIYFHLMCLSMCAYMVRNRGG